jgi:response regulator RpfG family c-di-GMP phosphodiesterase
VDEAVAEVARQRGDLFDPNVVDAFMAIRNASRPLR